MKISKGLQETIDIINFNNYCEKIGLSQLANFCISLVEKYKPITEPTIKDTTNSTTKFLTFTIRSIKFNGQFGDATISLHINQNVNDEPCVDRVTAIINTLGLEKGSCNHSYKLEVSSKESAPVNLRRTQKFLASMKTAITPYHKPTTPQGCYYMVKDNCGNISLISKFGEDTTVNQINNLTTENTGFAGFTEIDYQN